MRFGRAADHNQPDIVAALEQVGARVCDLHDFGRGVPDLLVCFQARLYLIEVKREGPPSAKRLTKAELAFACRFPVAVVCTPREALKAIGLETA